MRVLAVLLAATAVVAPTPRWSWPVPSHRVLRPFEAPATVYAAGHRGIDVAAPVGSPVRAPAAGTVVYAGRLVDRGVVAIDTAGARASLEPVEPRVRAGERVAAGQVVGTVGTGGDHAPGVLHLGARVRDGTAWAYVDPLLLLGGAQHAVLLPLSAFPG